MTNKRLFAGMGMVVDPQYNREMDCMPFPCFFLADGKGVCYTVCYE
ncbi:hypothetical protein RUMOBE_00874 [Blautia obeum ATCC 29174]|uniref:Uncharacterized protein n=1 Tax=Blautia obeum ATCC 29174 TaxID=411459 RepID=A5ZPF7_9FIRM|nr:hypothetical protein RUMOBE_00874 [Blautia obeum ATCC 29174]